MRRAWMAMVVCVSVLGPIAGSPADASVCPAGFEVVVLPGGTAQCAHDDAPPATNHHRSTSLFSAAAEARRLSCFGTGQEGNRLQAVYVTEGAPSLSSSDRAAIEVGMINTEAIYADSSMAVSNVGLVPRWAHTADCEPSIEVVSVPSGALDDFGSTIRAIAGMGFDRPDRKYIMWADSERLCGIASVSLDDRKVNNANDGGTPGYARVDRSCWGHRGSVVAHEVTHTLGAVLPSAPNATASGHCTDEYDIMCYDDAPGATMQIVCPDRGSDLLLDCNNDDYFHPEPPPGSWLRTHWNVADSSFLERLLPDAAVAPDHQFLDVDPAMPLRESIDWLAERGVTRGCAEQRFCPSDAVTRGQMAAFLNRFAGAGGSGFGSAGFSDVGSDHPFGADIAWLAQTGVTRGCGQSGFCPDLPVSRGQMAAFLFRLLGGEAPGSGVSFFDVPIDHPFAGEIAWVAELGVSNGCGDGGFCPDAPITRAQMAAFLHRVSAVLGV